MAAGFLPFVAWEVFSIVYYGFPFPNTAYAKLHTGIPALDLARQGLYYFANSLRMDPLTVIVIALGLTAAVVMRRRRQIMIAIGVLLYLAYLVKIGGDFMGGRFLAVPLFCSVLLLASIPLRPSRTLSAVLGGLAAASVVAGLCGPAPNLLSGADYGRVHKDRVYKGISDERAGCYPCTGLLRGVHPVDVPNHRWVEEALSLRREGTGIEIYGGIGFRGYFAGPDVRLIDFLALTDPLLARLPAESARHWRIGHFRRVIPAGYKDTVASGQNRLKDPNLALFYDKLALITQAPLASPGRWRAIWDMNLGRYDYLIDRNEHGPATSQGHAIH